MDSLFVEPDDEAPEALPESNSPLAARMRPRTLDEIAGQQHILAEGKLLRRAIEADRFTSLIFYGPPGTGKTTLATVVANTTGSRFESLNGVESNVAEIRAKIEQARTYTKLRDQTTILFIDEIHRFNKAQQDVLLPHIERGTVRFIGATTHNPYFYVNSPLVSRSQIFQLEPVDSADDLLVLLKRALADSRTRLRIAIPYPDRGPEALRPPCRQGRRRRPQRLSPPSNSRSSPPRRDRRRASIHLTLAVAEESIQQKADRLRCRRRPALRHHLGLHQIDSRLRPGLRELIAGDHAKTLGLASRLIAEAPRRTPLFLATFLHAMGKVHGGDRPDRGAQMARKIAERLGLSAMDVEHVAWLIENQRSLYHWATRRDTTDPTVLGEIAERVGTTERLRDLYLLTVAVISTTNPTALSAWKARMLEDLYFGLRSLEGRRPSGASRAKAIRDEVRVGFVGDKDPGGSRSVSFRDARSLRPREPGRRHSATRALGARRQRRGRAPHRAGAERRADRGGGDRQ